MRYGSCPFKPTQTRPTIGSFSYLRPTTENGKETSEWGNGATHSVEASPTAKLGIGGAAELYGEASGLLRWLNASGIEWQRSTSSFVRPSCLSVEGRGLLSSDLSSEGGQPRRRRLLW